MYGDYHFQPQMISMERITVDIIVRHPNFLM